MHKNVFLPHMGLLNSHTYRAQYKANMYSFIFSIFSLHLYRLSFFPLSQVKFNVSPFQSSFSSISLPNPPTPSPFRTRSLKTSITTHTLTRGSVFFFRGRCSSSSVTRLNRGFIQVLSFMHRRRILCNLQFPLYF